MPIDPSQAPTKLVCTGVDGDTAQAMPEIHEGKRLEQLLALHRYEKAEFAKIVGVTKQAVQAWTKAERFSPSIWKKILVGLGFFKLNPADIRPEEYTAREPVEDLTRLVDNWPRVQLSVLKRILESDDAARRVLLAYVNGALREGQ